MSPVTQITHCLPTGLLGTSELPVPNVSGQTITVTTSAAAGQRRGVFVYFHGLYTTPVQFPIPFVPGDAASAFGSGMNASLLNNLAADGYVCISVPAQEDTVSGIPSAGVYADVMNDAGYGARYVASTLHTWDHIYQYIQSTYGAVPVFTGGFSIGGWRALIVSQYRNNQTECFLAHQPASVFENVTNTYTPGYTFGNINWSGANLGTTALFAEPAPVGIVGYSSADTAVWSGGYAPAITVNGATTPVAAASLTSMTVAANTAGLQVGATPSLNFNAGPGNVTITGLTGGTSQGRATYTYSTYSNGSFGTLSLVRGSGTVGPGAAVVQSMIDSFLYNNSQVVRNAVLEPHSLGITDSGAYYAGTATTIAALNTLTTLQITTTQAACQAFSVQALTSGACAIQDVAGIWHPLTFGGVSSPNLTSVVISGAGNIAANAPICNTGTPAQNGFSNISYPYWWNKNVTPFYPRFF